MLQNQEVCKGGMNEWLNYCTKWLWWEKKNKKPHTGRSVISRLFPGVQVGRIDEPICSRCVAAGARGVRPLAHKIQADSNRHKGGENIETPLGNSAKQFLLVSHQALLVTESPKYNFNSPSWVAQGFVLLWHCCKISSHLCAANC